MEIYSDEYFMKLALQEAQIAVESGEVPIGAVIAAGDQLLARCHNSTDDLERAAEAAVARRIETLLVDADRRRPGRIDAVSGQFSPGSISAPEIDDALDDLAEMVLHAGGDVVVVPSPRMPTEAGCAAILRF
jgi:hypothetical protein